MERGFLRPSFVLRVCQDANQELDSESSRPKIWIHAVLQVAAALPGTGKRSKKGVPKPVQQQSSSPWAAQLKPCHLSSKAGKKRNKEKEGCCVRGSFRRVIRKNFFLKALEQAAQGSGGVTTPGGGQKRRGHGTRGRGLVGLVVLG